MSYPSPSHYAVARPWLILACVVGALLWAFA